jgi:hypothetical protein
LKIQVDMIARAFHQVSRQCHNTCFFVSATTCESWIRSSPETIIVELVPEMSTLKQLGLARSAQPFLGNETPATTF